MKEIELQKIGKYLKYKYDFMTSKKIQNQTNAEILYKLTR